MDCFPQLASGATGQFPIQKRRSTRTVVNEAADGRQIKWPDTGDAVLEWELPFEGITDDERDCIERFFARMEGSLKSFTFLDPTDNLLEWSEDLSATIWEKDPQLSLTSGVADPLGSTRATHIANPTAAEGHLKQTINAPGTYVYAFSVYARAASGGEMRLSRVSGSSVQEMSCQLGAQWKRYLLTGGFATAEDAVRFELQIGAYVNAEVFGLQVEAQPGASTYRQTLSRSGVYAAARFQNDVLEITHTGPGQHSARVLIRARR